MAAVKNMLKEGMDINARAKGCTCCVVGRGVAGGRCGGLGGGVAGRRGGGERRGRRQAHDDDTRLTHASHSLTRTRAHTHTHARAHIHTGTHAHAHDRVMHHPALLPLTRTSEARRLLGRPYGGGLPCTSRVVGACRAPRWAGRTVVWCRHSKSPCVVSAVHVTCAPRLCPGLGR